MRQLNRRTVALHADSNTKDHMSALRNSIRQMPVGWNANNMGWSFEALSSQGTTAFTAETSAPSICIPAFSWYPKILQGGCLVSPEELSKEITPIWCMFWIQCPLKFNDLLNHHTRSCCSKPSLKILLQKNSYSYSNRIWPSPKK